ncbi:DUF5050 domain-containing protein [Olleya marilimosa]|uniref:DUF5050 domain-containing protein n=1 Tax=Olleya marilimosa TaxID=272164 RepID=A0ABR8LYG7_9FLAO|nr:DUF5050 domain-containing protein [Olleya marilimosa]MBD3864691.1 DUF5050 domain-containing protein [Olleya marilimosa]MBD3892250.1 DUF5050 domain-containing protein [Olleya marilimosa]
MRKSIFLILTLWVFQIKAQDNPRLLIDHFGGAGGVYAYNLRINQSILFHHFNDTDTYIDIIGLDVTEQNPTSMIIAQNDNYGTSGIYDVNNDYIFISQLAYDKIVKKNRVSGSISDVCLSSKARWMRQHNDYIFFIDADNNFYKTNYTDTNLNDKELVLNNTVSEIELLTFYGDELFFLNKSTNKISKIDINSTMPQIEDVISFSINGTFSISENYLYYCDLINNNYSLLRINLLTNAQPIVLSTNFIASSIVVKGGYIYYIKQNGTGQSIYESNLGDILSTEEYENNNEITLETTGINFIKINNLKTSEKYIIYDLSGREVIKGIIFPKEEINIRNISSGLWILKLENGSTFKFLKK